MAFSVLSLSIRGRQKKRAMYQDDACHARAPSVHYISTFPQESRTTTCLQYAEMSRDNPLNAALLACFVRCDPVPEVGSEMKQNYDARGTLHGVLNIKIIFTDVGVLHSFLGEVDPVFIRGLS